MNFNRYFNNIGEFLTRDKVISRVEFALWLSLLLLNIVYTIYLILIAYFNRFSLDDYCFLDVMNKHGYWGSFNFWYENWQGRLAPYLIINLVLYSKSDTSLFIYCLVLFTGYLSGIFCLLKTINSRISAGINNYRLIVCSLLIFNTFTIIIFDVSTIFWLNVSAMYIAGVLSVIWLAYFLAQNKKTTFNYVFVVIFSCYAGFSSENFNLICLTMLFIIGVLLYLKARAVPPALLVSILVFFITFVIMFSAPGNRVRMAMYPPASFESTITATFRIFFSFTNEMGNHFAQAFFLSLPFLLLGSSCKTHFALLQKQAIALFVLLLTGFVLFEFMTVLPMAYAKSRLGPLRAYSYFSFFIVALVSVVLFAFGLMMRVYFKSVLYISAISLLVMTIVIIKCYGKKLPETIKYVRSEDQFISKLKKYNPEKGTVLSPVIYKSEDVVLKINDLNTDSTDWAGTCLKDALLLDFDIPLP